MNRLEGLHQADAAIVGGGLTGLLVASLLAHEGMKVAVIEARETLCLPPAAAASLDPGALARLEAAHGASIAQQYIRAWQAEQQQLLTKPLPYVGKTDVYDYAATSAELPALERQQELYSRLNLPCSVAPDAGGCPFPVELSLIVQNQPIINLAAWSDTLQKAILQQRGRIFTSSRVVALDGQRICTQYGCMAASHIILATGKPPKMHDRHFLALLESRRLAWCTLNGNVPLHTCQRAIQDGLTLFPTRGAITAIQDCGRIGSHPQQQRLSRFCDELHRLLPDFALGELRISQTVHSMDGLPVIGVHPGSHALFASGVSSIPGAMHAARVLTRRILGKTLPEDALYASDRPMRIKARREGLQVISGILRRNAPACSNCRRGVRYSPSASLWECPYCGSAFTMLGQVVSGPAVHQATVSVRQRPDW